MALIKCKECGKQISDTANVCMGCGAPVGGGVSVGNVAFEKRIEQYKAKGFSLLKRDGNTVKMRGKKIVDNKQRLVLRLLGIFFIILGTVFMFAGSLGEIGFLGYIGGMLSVMAGVALITILGKDVSISLTTTGKIEEVGNVLK